MFGVILSDLQINKQNRQVSKWDISFLQSCMNIDLLPGMESHSATFRGFIIGGGLKDEMPPCHPIVVDFQGCCVHWHTWVFNTHVQIDAMV